MKKRRLILGSFGAALLGALVIAVGLVVLGPRGESRIVPIDPADVPFALLRDADSTTPTSTTLSREPSMTLFFTALDGLVAVQRPRSSAPSLRDALQALIAGPTKVERDRGVTSLVPSETKLRRVSIDGSRAVIDLVAPFDEAPRSADRRLPVAQFVYTATALPGVTEVRFLVDGEPVEVPTGNSTLTRRPVSRSDYPGPVS